MEAAYLHGSFPSSIHFTVKIEAGWTSETLVSHHITARYQNPEEQDLNILRIFVAFLSLPREYRDIISKSLVIHHSWSSSHLIRRCTGSDIYR
jgi:hypothetical protein